MLRSLFRAVIDRLKALFASAAVAELEADSLARAAGRQAELLRLAEGYAAEGLPLVAEGLRRHVDELSADRPAGSVLPALAHLLDGAADSDVPALPAPRPTPSMPTARRKGR